MLVLPGSAFGPVSSRLALASATTAGDATPDAGLGDTVWPLLGNGGYGVERQRLDFDFSDNLTAYTARTTLVARATETLPSFNLDLRGPRVRAVKVDGRAADWKSTPGGELVVSLDRPVPTGAKFRVVVEVSDRVAAARRLTVFPPGLVRQGEWVQMISQPSGSHRALALSDHPSQKAPTTIVITAPSRLNSVANGHLFRTTRRGDRTTRYFREGRSLATELLQVGVGPFTVLRRPGPHGLRMRFAVPIGRAEAMAAPLRSFDRSIRWLENRLGRFPGSIAGAYATPLGGELETQGLTLLKAGQLMPAAFEANGVATIVLHEVAHEWFGNSVSPRRWSDLWLNEGHAVYYERLWASRQGGPRLRNFMRELYEGLGNDILSHGPIASPNPDAWQGKEANLRPYSEAAYLGGALTLFALREEVGGQDFRKIERAWVDQYRDRVAGTADFAALASRIAGRDLKPFFDGWLYGDRLPAMPKHDDWSVGD